MNQERLQKIIASYGLASRRDAEKWIKDGAVTVNGAIAKLGDKADAAEDAIKVNGKLLNPKNKEAKKYVAFYKPRGVISMMTRDTEGRPTLRNFFPRLKTRLFPIGRLDFNGEGLVLLTNDGDLSKKVLENPDMIRVYEVKVKGFPDNEQLQRLERGAVIEGKLIKPLSVSIKERLKSKSRIQVVFRGPNASDVKELFDAKRFLVERIVRTQIGHITLKRLEPGQSLDLKKSQILTLLEQPTLGLQNLDYPIHLH